MDTTHGPIGEDQHALMNAVAQALDDLFNGRPLAGQARERRVAFVVLTAKFDEYADGRVNYISNAHREDMLTMMKELIGRMQH